MKIINTLTQGHQIHTGQMYFSFRRAFKTDGNRVVRCMHNLCKPCTIVINAEICICTYFVASCFVVTCRCHHIAPLAGNSERLCVPNDFRPPQQRAQKQICVL